MELTGILVLIIMQINQTHIWNINCCINYDANITIYGTFFTVNRPLY